MPFSLGDAFLKYLSTVYVFVTYPSHNEGALHTARQRMISNKSLFQSASRVGLPAYIQAKPFAPKQWRPPNFKLNQPSRAPDTKAAQDLGDDIGEGSQAMNIVEESSMDIPEHSLSHHETSTTPVPIQKPNKRSKRQSEDMQWLGDKVTYLQSKISRPKSRLLYTGHRRCCRGHHRSCLFNRGA